MLLIFLIIILEIAAKWQLFEKMGAKGWKSLIPIYNTYTELVCLGINPWWLLINYGLPVFQPALNIYFLILKNKSLANSFKQGTGTVWGLIFLPFIFVPVLAFTSDVTFEGKKPMKDIIFDNFLKF